MKKSLLIISIIAATAFSAFAQPYGQGRQGDRRGMGAAAERIPDLTEEQKDQIYELRRGFLEYSLEKRGQMKVLHSEYKLLMVSDTKDLTAIDKNIEERSALRADMMKEKTRLQLDIRELLSEEQQVFFDNRMLTPGRMGKQGPRGRGPGRI
jgi:Spy/CpxP family protein refolding chaperone